MKGLVTGAAGFQGSRLREVSCQPNHEAQGSCALVFPANVDPQTIIRRAAPWWRTRKAACRHK